MPMHYGRKSRESEAFSLPDVEVFFVSEKEAARCTAEALAEGTDPDFTPGTFAPGWYWWKCFPGCMPDSDPCGPFATEAEALADAREAEGLCPHGCDDDEECAECDAQEGGAR